MTSHKVRAVRLALIVAAALFLAQAVLWSHPAQAQALALNWTGRVTAMPNGGLTGQWVVGGRTFTAGASTDFRQDKGALALAGDKDQAAKALKTYLELAPNGAGAAHAKEMLAK